MLAVLFRSSISFLPMILTSNKSVKVTYYNRRFDSFSLFQLVLTLYISKQVLDARSSSQIVLCECFISSMCYAFNYQYISPLILFYLILTLLVFAWYIFPIPLFSSFLCNFVLGMTLINNMQLNVDYLFSNLSLYLLIEKVHFIMERKTYSKGKL